MIKDIISSRKLESLIMDALNGNHKSQETLIDIVNRNARLTNSRMRALKKAGYDMFAYDRADTALVTMGRKNFKTTWTEQSMDDNIEDFFLTARETRGFLANEQSTVSGAKRKSERFLNQMETYGWINREELSKDTEKTLVHLMGSGGLRELISITYESVDDVLSTITDDIESGGTYDEIANKIDSILGGYMEYDDYFKVL